MIGVISMFRSCSDAHLQRYFDQVRDLPPDTKLIAIEGDSTDDTRARLIRHLETCGRAYELVIREHGGPHMGSVDHPERMRQCAFAANGGFDAVTADMESVVWVESDLIWKANTLLRLVAQLREGVDIIAPSIFMGRLFYDVWGYRGLNGQKFAWTLPFHPQLFPDGLTAMSSVGSCVVMRGEVARSVRLPAEDALVGFCREARGQGYRVWLDWRERVNHPER